MDETRLLAIRAALSRMLPAGVVVSLGTITGTAPPLAARELTSTSRMSRRRFQEFAAGRRQARHVLEQLGVHSPEVPMGPDRAPQWPAGYTGSISHAGNLALAVAVPATVLCSIGVDIEPAVPLDANLMQRVCRPEELARMDPSASALQRAKLLFSAKESVYKCISPLANTFLEFEDVEILFEPGERRFRARGHGPAAASLVVPSTLAGAFAEAGGYWVTAFWQPQPTGNGQE